MKLPWALVSPALVVLTGLGSVPAATAAHLLAPSSDPAAQVSSVSSVSTSAPTQKLQTAAGTDAASVATPLGFYWQLTTAQDVLPGTVLVPRGHHAKDRGTRSDEQFFQISSTGSNDVPEAALRAYHHAAQVMAQEDPGCGIPWTMLAAIGRVESNHGRFGGSQLGSDGVSRPAILGPQLNGAGAFAAIHDSDHGALDGDKVWDRAVGQMQFLPSTWSSVARDGDGDGVKNPNDIDDSALSAAVYLCGAGGSLADQAGMARAAFRYNHSDYYVNLVLSFQRGYETGVFAVPSPPPPPDKERVRTTKHATKTTKTGTSATSGTTKPTLPKPTPTGPSTKPTPTTNPSPSPSPLQQLSGTWTACGPTYCVGGSTLDLGAQNTWGDQASGDLDGDGTVETKAQEFDGLVGQHVNLQVVPSGSNAVVYVIGGQGLRNADGSFVRGVVSQVSSGASSVSPSPSPAP